MFWNYVHEHLRDQFCVFALISDHNFLLLSVTARTQKYEKCFNIAFIALTFGLPHIFYTSYVKFCEYNLFHFIYICVSLFFFGLKTFKSSVLKAASKIKLPKIFFATAYVKSQKKVLAKFKRFLCHFLECWCLGKLQQDYVSNALMLT